MTQNQATLKFWALELSADTLENRGAMQHKSTPIM